jgi:hypothetical protein
MSESVSLHSNESASSTTNLFGLKFLSVEKLEQQRFGLMVVLILAVGCLGGIAVGTGALTQLFSLVILVFTTMLALSMMLAVAPIKAIVYTSAAAIFADIFIIVFNLLG